MIRSLVLENFRRHAYTELRFDESGQIVLISGDNGAGKTTLLEAITFAFYGESRLGKRNLDQLTRRGAELEGMQVELVFDVEDDEYRIQRRRDGRSVTAVLSANGIPLVEGPNAVTDAVIRLLGMDSNGFRLAVIAQQKDLEGLSSLRPAERSLAIRRLLRLDALTSARDDAQVEFRRRRDLVRELRTGVVTEDVQAELTAAEAERDTFELERVASQDAVTSITAALASGTDIDIRWQTASAAMERARTRHDQEMAALAGADSELDSVVVPEAADDEVDIAEPSRALADAERNLANAQAAERTKKHRASIEAEIEIVSKRIGQLGEIRSLADLDTSRSALEVEIAHHLTQHSLLEELRTTARQELLALQTTIELTQERYERAGSVGAACDSCGQDVTEAHRLSHLADLEDELEALEARVSRATADSKDRDAAFEASQLGLAALKERLESNRNERQSAERAIEEHVDLMRRLTTYQDQLERIGAEDYDLASVQAERDLAARVLDAAVLAQQRRQERAIALARRADLLRVRDVAVERVAGARQEVAATTLDADLAAAWERRQAMRASREEEVRLERALALEVAAASSRVDAAKARLARHVADVQRISELEHGAVVASHAGTLLAGTADQLATRVRPLLEATMSQLLATMSDGRFEGVRLDDNYDVTVLDDGSYRPLTELSGGETDLVALAMRLALSQVVADRTGSGPGFLILDECFASQDAGRRASVLSALRNLRATYGQIFLISHVENIEDSVDTVVDVVLEDGIAMAVVA